MDATPLFCARSCAKPCVSDAVVHSQQLLQGEMPAAVGQLERVSTVSTDVGREGRSCKPVGGGKTASEHAQASG